MASREEFASLIAAAPYDDELYMIYGDLLQQHGDPRGELIAIDASAARAPNDASWRSRRAAWLAEHPELIPPDDGVELTWHLGFVRRVYVHDYSRYFTELASHPSLAFATELVVSAPGHPIDVMSIAAMLPRLSRLALGDPDARSWGRKDNTVYDLAPIVSRLEEFDTSVAVEFEHAPLLRRLSIREVDVPALERLVHAKLPALEHLSLKLQQPRYRGADLPPVERVEAVHLRALFDAAPPRLTTLELVDTPPGDAVIAALAESPLLARLRVLRLWNAGLTEAALRHVTREAFGHLELLDLTDPLIDPELAARFSTACKIRTTTPALDRVLRRFSSKA